jgi:transposase-like protein
LNVRKHKGNQCLLAVLGASQDGHKELLELSEVFAESKESWKWLLLKLKSLGMPAPLAAIGDAALGTWAGLREVFPDARKQLCRFRIIQSATDKRLRKKAGPWPGII